MNTHWQAAIRRRWLAASTLLLLSIITAPAMAQSCNANPDAIIAQANQTVPESAGGVATVVTLDGSASKPNAGNQAPTFIWQQTGSTPAGTAVTLQNSNSRVATFSAPNVTGSTSLTFELRVTCGSKSHTAIAVVNITNVVTNAAPTAVATVSPALIQEGSLVTLDGSGSYDIDNLPITSGLTYQWTQIGDDGQPVAGGVNFNQPATNALVTFVAPNTASGVNGTTLKFRLVVSDGSLTAFTEKVVTVEWLNDPPFATIACPLDGIAVGEGEMVTLDGNGSFDNDDGIVSYLWQQQNGTPDAGVTGASTAVLQFTAPALSFNELGILQFRLTVQDHTGDLAEAECGVVIHDITPPVISAQSDIFSEAESAAGTAVTFSIRAQDAAEDEFDYPVEQDCSPPSGHVFPLGTLPALQTVTPVSCAASDSKGNVSVRNFSVTVRDSTAPAFVDPPGSFATQATGPSGAVANFGLINTSDAVDGIGVAICDLASGSVFPVGTTPVTCTATDARGNSANTGFPVTVYDTLAPVLSGVSGNVAGIEATSPAGASVSWTAPTAHDLVDGNRPVSCLPASGSTFPLGTTEVTCSASDTRGNTASDTFNVTVVDTTAPALSGISDDIADVEATSPAGAAVSWTNPTALDIVDGSRPVSCLPASGSTFPLGTTEVTCSASDTRGNTASDTFNVTVVDTTAPALTLPGNLTPEATSALGAAVSFTATAVDLVSGSVAVDCTPASGSTFPLGVATIVNCGATDAAGNTGSGSFSVTVRDTTGPTIAPHADVTASATGNSSAVVTYTLPTATDLVDGLVPVSCTPASGSTFNVGTTTVTCNAQDGRTPPNVAQSTTFKVIVSYTFNGFFRPIDNLPTINVVKAGSAIPVKFSLGGNQGLSIFAANYPASVSTACSASQTDAVEETVTAGSSSLQYDPGADQYIYVWKTDKNWTGCRQLQVKLRDGSSRWATFSFTR
jgi:hypothetical protein